MLSESLARKRWPNEDPIVASPWKDKGDTVVGVVGNTRAMELKQYGRNRAVCAASGRFVSKYVSAGKDTAGAPGTLTPAIKQIAANSIDPKIFPSITPLKSGYLKSVRTVEQIAGLISLLGGLAVCLAVVGLLGLGELHGIAADAGDCNSAGARCAAREGRLGDTASLPVAGSRGIRLLESRLRPRFHRFSGGRWASAARSNQLRGGDCAAGREFWRLQYSCRSAGLCGWMWRGFCTLAIRN